jgi:beta propeller repeat protein
MKRLKSNLRDGAVRVMVLVFIDVMMCCVALADPSWVITQLTHNWADDRWPAISGTNVVWDGPGETLSNFAGKLANRSGAWGIGSFPAISGTNAVWQDYDGADWEIYSNFAGQLTNNSAPNGGYVEDRRPAISGTNVVWELNEGIESNFAGHIADSLWPWVGVWPMGHYPDISGTNVVWQDFDGQYWQIYSNFAGQLTTGNVDHMHPAISGTNVVWETPGGIESNFAGHVADTQSWFAPTNFWPWAPGSYPAISGTNVVWQDYVGGQGWRVLTNFAGQLTTTTTSDMYPDISGTNVVWQGWDGSDWEIYMRSYASNVVPVPGAVFLGILGLSMAGLKLRRYV